MKTELNAPMVDNRGNTSVGYIPGSYWRLPAAIVGLVVTCVLPTPAGLPVAGQYMLGILLFSVILWITEAVDYAISAVLIVALMAFLLGLAPSVANPAQTLGTSGALTLALGGFANASFALVGAALFLAAAMTITGLDKRVALVILSKVGTRTNRIVIGAIITGVVLSFLIPSTTARVACLVPIMMGMVLAFNIDRKSKLAGVMLVSTAQAASIWNVGVKTAAAQNMVAIGFIEKVLKATVTWLDWFIAAAPWAALMSVALYFVMMKMMPPETDEVPGGKAAIAKALHEMGPMTLNEKKLLFVTVMLLGFWSTEQVLHKFDTSSTTIAAIALMFLPWIGVMDWKEAQARVPWGTLVLFGVGISLGTALLQTKAAGWLASVIVHNLGLVNAPAFAVLALLSLFLIVVHLGFASATALASAMIPIMIGVLQQIQTPGLNIVGITIILQFSVSFGFILPVNAPQNMVAYGTETFSAKDFIRTGLVLTIIGYVLMLIFGATYWQWLGMLTTK